MKPERRLSERLCRYAGEANRVKRMLAAHYPDEVERWEKEAEDLNRLAEEQAKREEVPDSLGIRVGRHRL